MHTPTAFLLAGEDREREKVKNRNIVAQNGIYVI